MSDAGASSHRTIMGTTGNRFQIKVLGGGFIILCVCEVLLVIDVLAEFSGLDFSFYHDIHAVTETIAVLALGVTLIVIAYDLRRLLRENESYRDVVGVASGEFVRILNSKFKEWQLSASESEVAMLLIKGLSIQEIADIRQTKPGTIKSQASMLYKKAGVKGRNELVAYFVEDLLSGEQLTNEAT